MTKRTITGRIPSDPPIQNIPVPRTELGDSIRQPFIEGARLVENKKSDDIERKTCHDCGVLEGQLHHPGCDMETCPWCLGQSISCVCCYEHLGINIDPGTEGFDAKVYNEGLNEEQERRWDALLKQKGRIPYVRIPNLCALCGETYPVMFHSSTWNCYVPPTLQHKMLCKKCFEWLKEIMPNGWKSAE